jgi:Fe-S-cluster-containing hydrogenase component 2/CRP-like cAMP-binding protein
MANESVISPKDGLSGQWLSLEEMAELDFFKSGKRAFKIKLNTNFAPAPGKPDPGIKAAVRREYQKGQIICEAGAYGSTAFLLLEGSAVAYLPERSAAKQLPGRNRWSISRLKGIFARRTRSRVAEPAESDAGEVSAYASVACEKPPARVTLRPGDFFGIDTCVNFYPREATVRAEERCVAIEMLRSVLDTVRDAGSSGGKVESTYRETAIRDQLRLSRLFDELSDEQLERLAAGSELLTPDSDQVRDGVICNEGDPADAVFLVRAGSIKIVQRRTGGELIFSYLGRGSAFGFEGLLPSRERLPWRLRCVSHPSLLPEVEVGTALTIGRSASCDVAVPDENRAVGRRHCRLELRQGDLYLLDLDSANFTLLNGERISEAIVSPGDRITVVDYVFELVRPASVPTEPGKVPLRFASGVGLDNFEVVKVKVEDLLGLARENQQMLASVTTVARSLESIVYQRSAGDQSLTAELIDLNLYNSQNTLLIDLDRCTRCDECVRACSDAHGGVARFTRDGPRFGNYLVTMACRSCTDPKCMIGCPVGSIRRRDSLEIIIEDWCIGCERCANQCPFGNINMLELAPAGKKAADTTDAAPTSVAPAAPQLKATVCDLCRGYDGPSCVYACPHDAAIRVRPTTFLSLEDLR